ncbi:MAG TPA: hypothetical protein PKC39_13295 [Ferruginibacter sp.]|nr:hypothetical protein [Ferruginibacter sp.]HMP21929.1 hypothetical protein [Ferruginibacter sp.]
MKYTLLAFLFLLRLPVFAQSDKEGSIRDITKITLLNPGFAYEKAIGQFQSVYLQAFINASATRTDFFGETERKYYLDPAFTAQYRYYYNYTKRQEKKLRTSNNNLNYVSGLIQTFFSKIPIEDLEYTPEKRRAVNFAGAAWGIQRNYPKRFCLDLGLGLGVLFTKTTYNEFFSAEKKTINQVMPYPYLQLNIGFWLNKQQE